MRMAGQKYVTLFIFVDREIEPLSLMGRTLAPSGKVIVFKSCSDD